MSNEKQENFRYDIISGITLSTVFEKIVKSFTKETEQ